MLKAFRRKAGCAAGRERPWRRSGWRQHPHCLLVGTEGLSRSLLISLLPVTRRLNCRPSVMQCAVLILYIQLHIFTGTVQQISGIPLRKRNTSHICTSFPSSCLCSEWWHTVCVCSALHLVRQAHRNSLSTAGQEETWLSGLPVVHSWKAALWDSPSFSTVHLLALAFFLPNKRGSYAVQAGLRLRVWLNLVPSPPE